MNIEEYLENKSIEINNQAQDECNLENSEPCALCGSKDFIQLYRNVVGEVEGKMQGHFSLFGGSISGYISGETKTLPVLSCKNCQNERLISTWQYKSKEDLFWEDIHDFYFGICNNNVESLNQIPNYYLDNFVDTYIFARDNRNWDYSFYNNILNWNFEVWKRAGFKIDKIKIRHSFLWWNWETEKWPEI